MNTEDGAKLYDVCPRPLCDAGSSQEPGGGVGGTFSCSSALGSTGGSLGFSAECGAGPGRPSGLGQCFPWKEGLCGRR